MSTPSPRVIEVAISGLGPRGAQFIAHLAIAVIEASKSIEALRATGRDFIIKVTVFDMQDEESAGCGNAFQVNCDALANTPVTTTPNAASIKDAPSPLSDFVNLRASLTAQFDADDYVFRTEQRNPVAAAMCTKNLLSDGKINPSLAFFTRGEWGRFQHTRFQEVLDYIRNNVPRLQISIHYRHRVVDTDLSNPQKPGLYVEGPEAADPQKYHFDFAYLIHGTTWQQPVVDAVAAAAHSLTPNHDTLSSYLQKQGLLHEGGGGGTLKSGTRIAITGHGLSAYDYITLLMPFLPAFKLSPDQPVGYDISEKVAADYRGLITLISRSPRSPLPRHLVGAEWSGDVSIFSTQEMHALRLQRNYNWMAVAEDLFAANVAYCTEQIPQDIERKRTIEEDMLRLYEQNIQHLIATPDSKRGCTEAGLLLGGRLRIAYGQGLEPDPIGAEKELARQAPLSRSLCFPWPMFRSGAKEATAPLVAVTDAGRDFNMRWEKLAFSAVAAPLPVQHLIALLYKRGIATHQTGDFKDIYVDEATGKVALEDSRFDALLAPKTISRDADKVFASFKGIEETVVGQPQYQKGRYLRNKEGIPIHVFDLGLGGHGTKTKEGTFGTQWNDTHSHSAAAELAPIQANLLLMHCLALINSRDPVPTVHAIYEQILPTDAEFSEETVQFAPVWREAQEKRVFLQLVKDLPEMNAEKYQHYFKNADSRDKRQHIIARESPEIAHTYDDRLNSIPIFNPVSRQQYQNRFVDFTSSQVAQMWKIFQALLADDFARLA